MGAVIGCFLLASCTKTIIEKVPVTPSPMPQPSSSLPTATPSFDVTTTGCSDDLKTLVDTETTLDSRLSTGVQFADYGRYVSDVRVA